MELLEVHELLFQLKWSVSQSILLLCKKKGGYDYRVPGGTTVVITAPNPAETIVLVGGCPACRVIYFKNLCDKDTY